MALDVGSQVPQGHPPQKFEKLEKKTSSLNSIWEARNVFKDDGVWLSITAESHSAEPHLESVFTAGSRGQVLSKLI